MINRRSGITCNRKPGAYIFLLGLLAQTSLYTGGEIYTKDRGGTLIMRRLIYSFSLEDREINGVVILIYVVPTRPCSLIVKNR